MCSCRATMPAEWLAQEAMDVCEKCGADLGAACGPFYRCERCGFENDAGKLCFACADEARPECAVCAEHLCRFYGGMVEPE